ncbi:polysaccharide deacetylase family protein [Aquibium carbonis]|uniref:Chitooligosaccharide deacetylase n=1 Tax=Aquibium carbonis TaxID=2495581 RepID=A0A429YSC9_9HYPH|nr:polysaccharide deacetylase family protein [Aquibium carbonis]
MRLLLLATIALALVGCANSPKQVSSSDGATLAFAPGEQTRNEASPHVAILRPGQPPAPRGGLAGRTISVSKTSDIRLGPKEVVLTFDDGPVPGKTDTILRALDQFGVKATFLMVGQMANAYPGTARKVAAAGHTIGTHTQNHKNLRTVSVNVAEAQIREGRESVAAALRPGGYRPAPFFRFPYLADTTTLRGSLAAQGIVVIDVDIDSRDYYASGSDALRARAVAAVERRGSGVILFHDLHARTATMLPLLLADLKERGYKVVHLVPARTGVDLIASSAPVALPKLETTSPDRG